MMQEVAADLDSHNLLEKFSDGALKFMKTKQILWQAAKPSMES